ncbi:cytosol nonspecific dipeptidase [Mergibacter septicus]|uniref:aminoacyl-histidine dipeptidase n=1 Tax=Mergibacter septicus TaxID=221402 RepID=UPI0011794B90|nr:aminoacyl-histidine dipeptidase [Mergibacter septicus]AWX13556.1 cytosol nonspecific dipeptidase [Mergibacter septicus]
MTDLQHLQPQLVWQWFERICQIPHPSYHEQALAQYIVDWAKEKQLWVERDQVGNILIRKPATAGMADCQTVALQAHLDMVPQANSTTEHNFTTDPIQPYVDGEWVKAKGTTLGADNGIGLASCLAVLDSQDLAHPRLEVLLTMTEETGMIGASGLQPNWLESEVMINTDTEQEGEIYIGCAGGEDADLSYPIEWQTCPDTTEQQAFQLALTGLKGGHSGAEIHLGRGNAIKLLVSILTALQGKVRFKLAEIKGGTIRNAIPREAFATLVIATSDQAKFTHALNQLNSDLMTEWQLAEPNLSLTIIQTGLPQRIFSEQSSQTTLAFLNSLPNGVIRYSDQLPEVVETSLSCGVLTTTTTAVEVVILARSLHPIGLDRVATILGSISQLAGAKLTLSNRYAGWNPNANAPIVKLTQQLYQQILGRDCAVKVIHAGLECGLINQAYPTMEMVSIGPTILGAHSPDERCHIPAVATYWQLLTRLLATIPSKK